MPTQLYHLLLCAGVGGLLLALRRRAAAGPGGSRYLLAMGLLCLGRGLIEFWRDPAGEPLLGAPLAGAGFPLLKIQVLLLLKAAVLLGSWAWLVRRGRPASLPEARPALRPATPALVGLGLLATARLTPAVLTLPEIAVLQALLLAEGYTWLVTLGRGVPRLPLALLLGGALLATAQAPAPQKEAPFATTISSAGYIGNAHDAESRYSANGCGGSNTTQVHQQV